MAEELLLAKAVRMPVDEHGLAETFLPGEEEAFLKAAPEIMVESLKRRGVLVSIDTSPSAPGAAPVFASPAAKKAFQSLGLIERDLDSVEPSSPKGYTKADLVDAAEAKGK